MKRKIRCFTIGHSTREIEEFVSLLKIHAIEALVDIRAFPVSRRNPQFNSDYLKAHLSRENIEYIWSGKEFGGYRSKAHGLGKNSPNKGWKTEGFRIYADYMLSGGFQNAAEKLIELVKKKTTACMCAEKFHWRCHRKLLSDYLLSRQVEVWHIIERDTLVRHELTKFARIKDGLLTYPPQDDWGGNQEKNIH
ncbi:MAG: DUF488 family protein [Candidatus Aminicenantales bacterium]